MRIHLAENMTKSYYLDMFVRCGVKNTLFSYVTAKSNYQDILNYINADNIIIDSGAFSAWTRNEQIDIDKYIQFCKSFKNRKENIYFVNLDVIPASPGRKPNTQQIEESAKKGWSNMEYMESKGLKVIHVFHQHEDFKWLLKLKERQDYIGISPANDVTKKQRIQWLDKVFSILRDTKKTHGFGATAKDIIYRYPWYSVDSTSWKAPGRFGSSCTENLTKRNMKSQPGIFMKAELINEIKRWLKIEKEATQLWTNRGVKWN